MGFNSAQAIRHWALRDPQRTAIVLADRPPDDGERNVSYAQLDALARGAAAQLAAHGLLAGDRVALSLPNGLAFLAAYFGAAYAGITVVPIPPMSSLPELRARFAQARCAALIADRTLPECRAIDAAALLAHEAPDAPPRELAPDAVAMLLYTSGTTGVAKGAMITHASLVAHTAALVHHVLRLSERDRVLATLPLTHSYGIRMTLLAPFYAGATSVLTERFALARALQLLEAERITWFPGVPTMFHAIAHGPAQPSAMLRWCLSAGAPLPREVRLRAEAKLGVPVRQGFGLTEATFSTVALPDDAGGEDTVGRPVFGVELRIVDATGKPCPPDTPGEVCVRGQNVMAGYLDEPEATGAVLRDGWLHSGDIGQLDDQGRLTIVDRIKDLIIRGGFNVYPAEVEAVLVAHPSVREAAVVGVPDERYGEDVLAVLVLHAGDTLSPEALSAFCREQLSRVKVPRLVAFVDALPTGPSGKVQRRELRRLALDGTLPTTQLP
ncbi:MAG TPA: AMP-binding protein [Polyangiales bacterium]